jgi:hypothetical protein
LEALGEREVKRRKNRAKRGNEPPRQDPGIRAHYGTPWAPPNDSPKKIDASRRMRFPPIVEEADISALEARTGLRVPAERRKRLRDELDVAFTVLAVGQHSANAAPPHQIRDRMEQLRDALHRSLAYLVVNPTDAESEEWEPSGTNFNTPVLTTLVDAANDDRSMILASTKAIGALARFADVARIKAEATIETGEARTSRMNRVACAQLVARAFVETFGKEPTETTGGAWEKFASWAFEFAGAPITPHAARDLLRAVKRSR